MQLLMDGRWVNWLFVDQCDLIIYAAMMTIVLLSSVKLMTIFMSID